MYFVIRKEFAQSQKNLEAPILSDLFVVLIEGNVKTVATVTKIAIFSGLVVTEMYATFLNLVINVGNCESLEDLCTEK